MIAPNASIYDVKVLDGGTIALGSSAGNVSIGDGVSLYGDAPDIKAGGAVHLVLEGNHGTLNVDAGGNVDITAISTDNKTSSLQLGTVKTSHGDVSIVAANGIEGATLIQGNRVELYSKSGDIGGSGALQINSNFNGSGGFSAKAAGDIHIVETAGDLKLLSFKGGASVQAGGDATLEAKAGSILDYTLELDALSATFDGTATVEMGDGTLPLPGVPFTVTVSTGSLALILDAAVLPTASLSAGSITIE